MENSERLIIAVNSIDKKNKYSITVYGILFIYFYALFALSRIKHFYTPRINGEPITNEVFIYFFVVCLIYVLRKTDNMYQTKPAAYGLFFYALFFISLIGAFKVDPFETYLYAVGIFFVPVFLFFLLRDVEVKHFYFLCKVFVCVSIVYSLLAVITSFNYAFFADLLGNTVQDSYYSQYRSSLMLGSSITVSYYLIISLPLCFYMFYTADKKWRRISLVAIIISVTAIIILLSRMAVVSLFIVIAFYLFIAKNKKTIHSRNILIATVSIIIVILANTVDVTRLLQGFSFTDSSSLARIGAAQLGIHLFAKNPIFGTGMGCYFERVFSNPVIIVDGIYGLVDPHNMYIMFLSEVGILGFILVCCIFGKMLNDFSKIKDKNIRQAAMITLIVFLIFSLGGSHIINEISYSAIFWIYMGLYRAISDSDTRSQEIRG
jgi:O-antigen ligase